MSADIKKLTIEHTKELMDLFLDCFQEDSYYQKLYPRDTRQNMQRFFKPALDFCIFHGVSFGYYEGGRLTGFILCFDYQKARCAYPGEFQNIFTGKPISGKPSDEGRALPYQAQIHDRVGCLGNRALYLLSIGVQKDRRGQGIASKLLDFVTEEFPTFAVAGDVSNESSLSLYRQRDFTICRIQDDYYYVEKRVSGRMQPEGLITTAFPSKEEVQKLFPYKEYTHTTIRGYLTGSSCGYPVFIREAGAQTPAVTASLSYVELLQYQRYINLCDYEEDFLDGLLIYSYAAGRREDAPGKRLYNDVLEDMIATREDEWSIIPDLYMMFPVEYEDLDVLESFHPAYDRTACTYMNLLDFRTQYEAGIPVRDAALDESSGFKKRIRRYYLGKLKLSISQEMSPDALAEQEPIGQPAYVDMILSVDLKSRCGVFYLMSLSSPFLLSHCLDNMIRNYLMVSDGSGQWTNLYTYIHEHFSLMKKGTPKAYVQIPASRHSLSVSQIASLLFTETIYASDELLGRVSDEDLLGIASSEAGMGQYDRAFVCAGSNIILNFEECLRGPLEDRLSDEAVTCFYMELILFEEAAIHIADDSIISFLTDKKRKNTIRFLRHAYRIFEDYSDTIDFWDIQVNYPSSRKSISMMREAFRMEDQLSYLARDQAQLQTMFDTRRDILDRVESTLLNYIMLLITIVQFVAIFNIEAPKDAISLSTLAMVGILFLFNSVKRAMTRSANRRKRGFSRPDGKR